MPVGWTPDVLEKPTSKEDQLRMLLDLNGQACEVVTGVTIVYPVLASPGYQIKYVVRYSSYCLSLPTRNIGPSCGFRQCYSSSPCSFHHHPISSFLKALSSHHPTAKTRILTRIMPPRSLLYHVLLAGLLLMRNRTTS
jgi:hypothetical protein